MATGANKSTSPDALAMAQTRISDLEEQLRRAQGQPVARLSPPPRTLLESPPDAITALDREFRFAWVQGIVYDWYPKTGIVQRSGSLEELIGIQIEKAEPTENWWQARVHPDDAANSTLNVITRLARDKTQFETEFRFKHANGDWIYLSDQGFVVRDENGDAVRVVGSTQNITERKRLEEALKESNKELKFQANILEATNDAVIALDPKLCIRYCNTAAERMYGVKLADVKGKPLLAMHGYAWLVPEDEQKFLADWAERGSWKGEYIHVLRSGTQIIVQSTVNKITEDAGGGMVAVIRDITERKQSEMRTRNQAAQLASANEDLLHFAYAVSHDLRTPLRTITSFSQLLTLKYKQNLDQRGNEFLGWIVAAGLRMDTMLCDLLQFAKAAGAEAVLEEVSLEQALSTAMESVRGVLQEARGAITHDVLPYVEADGGQLVELFENLIGNALKYRKPEVPPQIHISASRTDQDWMIAVRDNGMGFDAKDSERIFSVFQRLHGKEFPGSGIGLSICKRIVERRGGRIWADGTPDMGATFYFTIPDSTAGIRATSPGIQATPPMDWSKLLSMLESGKLADEPTIQTGHFDELFKTLDLAQAIVRRLDGTILIWTKGAERLFGWTEAEAVGKSLHELLGTEFLGAQKAVESVLLKTGEWAGELKACKKDGSHIWLATHKVLHRDGSGRPESVIEVHNDVTALKNASQALAETNALANLRLREIEAIYSQAPVGLLHLDTELRFVRLNEYLAGINGTPAASHIGRTVSDVLPQLGPIVETILRRVIDTRQPIKEEEVRGTTPSDPNAERTWLVSYFPFEGPDGVCLGLNGVVQDITQRKKIEIALLETAERLRIATSVAKLGVFVWEAETDRVLWENDRMYDIVGRKREEGPINNQEFLDSVVYAEDAPGYKKALAEAMEPCGFFRHQCRIRRSDGVIRLVEFAGQFDRESIGQGMRLVGVMSDLTDRAFGT